MLTRNIERNFRKLGKEAARRTTHAAMDEEHDAAIGLEDVLECFLYPGYNHEYFHEGPCTTTIEDVRAGYLRWRDARGDVTAALETEEALR